jgi:hypothetical protein
VHRRTADQTLYDAGVLRRPPRLTPRNRRAHPWQGVIVAIDTEGSADTGTFTATAQWDGGGGLTTARRFRRAADFADFLIERAQSRFPTLIYAHNLEWDLQVLWRWLDGTRLHYHSHIARRNGSALSAEFDFDGRNDKARRVVIRDSFAVWPLSLAQLGRSIGLPKLRTPRAYVPTIVHYATGAMIPAPPPDESEDVVLCDHGRVECLDCYDLRDVAILHAAMRMYVMECNEAGISPALTRSAHAMRDWRTNYLSAPMMQYTEKENLRAQIARYGGRSQMLVTGLTMTEPGDIMAQADIVSEYPSIMAKGNFPDAGHHVILHHPRAERVDEFVGWAWAEVTVPDVPLGALIYRDPRNGHIGYPTDCRIQAAWTTDELAYARSLGYTIKLTRLEGTPCADTIDPFSSFISDKWRARDAFKRVGDARESAVKLTMNGLSGKFGMRWTDPILAFRAPNGEDLHGADLIDPPYCVEDDIEPMRYPDYLMVPWSSLIMARGRVMLHRFGMELLSRGAELLCCDTDSWTFRAPSAILDAPLFGTQLGEWKLEDEQYTAFRGAAPKEYALYGSANELFSGQPNKCRAKGIGGTTSGGDRSTAVDHYLRTGNVHYQRPHKTRSVIRGATGASFATVEKTRHKPPLVLPPLLYSDWPAEVRRQIRTAHAGTLWLRHHPTTTEATIAV